MVRRRYSDYIRVVHPGERHQIHLRLPEKLYALAVTTASEHRLSLNELITELLYESLGHPDGTPIAKLNCEWCSTEFIAMCSKRRFCSKSCARKSWDHRQAMSG